MKLVENWEESIRVRPNRAAFRRRFRDGYIEVVSKEENDNIEFVYIIPFAKTAITYARYDFDFTSAVMLLKAADTAGDVFTMLRM